LNRGASNGNFSVKSDDTKILLSGSDVDSNDSKARIYSQSERTKKVVGVEGISKTNADVVKSPIFGSAKKNGS